MRTSLTLSLLFFGALVVGPIAGRAAPPEEAPPEDGPIVPADEVPAVVDDARSPSAKNPCRADGAPLSVFALGGSTMQIVLGPMLAKRFAADGFEVAYQGKSASGLARYDYFDWPKTVGTILTQHDPDVFVVALGSNDGQSLRETGGRWFHLDKPEWREEYARRIDAFLALLAGPDRRRAVIWSGPAAHSDDKKRRRGAVVSEVIRERIERFAGRAWYVDLFARTSTADGGALYGLKQSGRDEVVPLRTRDGFHLTRPAVEAMMFSPVQALLAACRKR